MNRAEHNSQGSQQFRLAEDLSNPRLRAQLQFWALGMVEGEALEIQLNGTTVPARLITYLFDPDGQSECLYRGHDQPFYLYLIDLDEKVLGPVMINGDNELTVRLIPTEAQGEGTVTIDELEVYVYVKR